MKSGVINMVLFPMRFAFRWDITSLAISYTLFANCIFILVHLIIFIPSMIELFQFGSRSLFCWFLGILFD